MELVPCLPAFEGHREVAKGKFARWQRWIWAMKEIVRVTHLGMTVCLMSVCIVEVPSSHLQPTRGLIDTYFEGEELHMVGI